jgi:hypothetical protein
MEAQDFNNLIIQLVRAAETSKSHDVIRSSIQTLGSISASSGFRLADCMGVVVPIVVACVQGQHKNLSSTELQEDDELRENCFQVMNYFHPTNALFRLKLQKTNDSFVCLFVCLFRRWNR